MSRSREFALGSSVIFFLAITSLPLDIIAGNAHATAVVVDQHETPAREAAPLKNRRSR